MSSERRPGDWTRREMLAAGCATVGTLVSSGIARAEGAGFQGPEGPYRPFRMGLQSYSLRGYTRDGHPDLPKALAVTQELGLLKDVKDAKTFTILGRGDLRMVDFLKALAQNQYGYCLAIEYQENPENPLEDIKACLAEARKAIAEVRSA